INVALVTRLLGTQPSRFNSALENMETLENAGELAMSSSGDGFTERLKASLKSKRGEPRSPRILFAPDAACRCKTARAEQSYKHRITVGNVYWGNIDR